MLTRYLKFGGSSLLRYGDIRLWKWNYLLRPIEKIPKKSKIFNYRVNFLKFFQLFWQSFLIYRGILPENLWGPPAKVELFYMHILFCCLDLPYQTLGVRDLVFKYGYHSGRRNHGSDSCCHLNSLGCHGTWGVLHTLINSNHGTQVTGLDNLLWLVQYTQFSIQLISYHHHHPLSLHLSNDQQESNILSLLMIHSVKLISSTWTIYATATDPWSNLGCECADKQSCVSSHAKSLLISGKGMSCARWEI